MLRDRRAAGVQLHPYTCRTTCLTQLKKLGASNDELQRQAGHASFVTTESAYLKDKNRRVEGLTREGLYGAEEVAS